MLKTLKPHFWAVFVVLLVACGNVAPEPTTTGLPTATYSPIIKMPDLPTVAPTSTTFSQPDFLKVQCADIRTTLPSDIEMQGMMVLWGSDSFLLDPKNGTKKPLKNMQADFIVSQDHKWLVSTFKDSQDKIWLLVKTAEGEEQKPIPWDEEHWFELGGWLDNERVWISHYLGPALTIINPFTGERQELAGDFPGIETIESIDRPLGDSKVIYNSSLSLAVYPRLEADGSYYLVLLDVQTKRVLAKIKHIFKSPPSKPIWSSDGTKVYIIESQSETESDNIFSMGQNGQVHQLTHFGESIDDAKLFGLSLSPDGTHLAFWLSLGPSFPLKEPLAALDLATGQVTNYCVTGPTEYGGLSYPTWSPDNRYLVVAQWYDTSSNRVVLLDTQQKWAVIVSEDVTPEGWLLDRSSP